MWSVQRGVKLPLEHCGAEREQTHLQSKFHCNGPTRGIAIPHLGSLMNQLYFSGLHMRARACAIWKEVHETTTWGLCACTVAYVCSTSTPVRLSVFYSYTCAFSLQGNVCDCNRVPQCIIWNECGKIDSHHYHWHPLPSSPPPLRHWKCVGM